MPHRRARLAPRDHHSMRGTPRMEEVGSEARRSRTERTGDLRDRGWSSPIEGSSDASDHRATDGLIGESGSSGLYTFGLFHVQVSQSFLFEPQFLDLAFPS